MRNDAAISDSLFRLIDACCEAYDNPNFKPRGGTTYCNQAVRFISERMGCFVFRPVVANEMIALMKNSGDWRAISIEEAQDYANKGHLVIAGLMAKPHGHVAVVRPGLPGISGKWKIGVPKVINVGAENFIAKSLSWAFREKPDVFVWLKPNSKKE